MALRLAVVAPSAVVALLPLLHDAEEDDERVKAALCNPAHTAYSAEEAGAQIGAAVMAWAAVESELLLLAVAPTHRRQGYGRQMVAALVAEARQRGTAALLVGTGNASWASIALYQQCGFRMDHIRRDYFAYVQPPISENGIPLRDMLVLRMELG